MKCAVLCCPNDRRHDCIKSYFRFPKDIIQCREWLISIGRMEFTPTESSNVCEDHFPEHFLQIGTNRKTLVENAVPRHDITICNACCQIKLEPCTDFYQQTFNSTFPNNVSQGSLVNTEIKQEPVEEPPQTETIPTLGEHFEVYCKPEDVKYEVTDDDDDDGDGDDDSDENEERDKADEGEEDEDDDEDEDEDEDNNSSKVQSQSQGVRPPNTGFNSQNMKVFEHNAIKHLLYNAYNKSQKTTPNKNGIKLASKLTIKECLESSDDEGTTDIEAKGLKWHEKLKKLRKILEKKNAAVRRLRDTNRGQKRKINQLNILVYDLRKKMEQEKPKKKKK